MLQNATGRRLLRNKALHLNEKTNEEKRFKFERPVNPRKDFLNEAIIVDEKLRFISLHKILQEI